MAQTWRLFFLLLVTNFVLSVFAETSNNVTVPTTTAQRARFGPADATSDSTSSSATPSDTLCPASDGTSYTAKGGDQYQVLCDTDLDGGGDGDITTVQAADTSSCIQACSDYNANNPNSGPSCVGISFSQGSCILKGTATVTSPYTGINSARLITSSSSSTTWSSSATSSSATSTPLSTTDSLSSISTSLTDQSSSTTLSITLPSTTDFLSSTLSSPINSSSLTSSSSPSSSVESSSSFSLSGLPGSTLLSANATSSLPFTLTNTTHTRGLSVSSPVVSPNSTSSKNASFSLTGSLPSTSTSTFGGFPNATGPGLSFNQSSISSIQNSSVPSATPSSVARSRRFALVLEDNGTSKLRKRNTDESLGVPCSDANSFYFENQQLFASDGSGQISAPFRKPFVPLKVSNNVQDITTSFSDQGGTLVWQNVDFSNGQASFCLQQLTAFAVLRFPPTGCVSVQISILDCNAAASTTPSPASVAGTSPSSTAAPAISKIIAGSVPKSLGETKSSASHHPSNSTQTSLPPAPAVLPPVIKIAFGDLNINFYCDRSYSNIFFAKLCVTCNIISVDRQSLTFSQAICEGCPQQIFRFSNKGISYLTPSSAIQTYIEYGQPVCLSCPVMDTFSVSANTLISATGGTSLGLPQILTYLASPTLSQAAAQTPVLVVDKAGANVAVVAPSDTTVVGAAVAGASEAFATNGVPHSLFSSVAGTATTLLTVATSAESGSFAYIATAVGVEHTTSEENVESVEASAVPSKQFEAGKAEAVTNVTDTALSQPSEGANVASDAIKTEDAEQIVEGATSTKVFVSSNAVSEVSETETSETETAQKVSESVAFAEGSGSTLVSESTSSESPALASGEAEVQTGGQATDQTGSSLTQTQESPVVSQEESVVAQDEAVPATTESAVVPAEGDAVSSETSTSSPVEQEMSGTEEAAAVSPVAGFTASPGEANAKKTLPGTAAEQLASSPTSGQATPGEAVSAATESPSAASEAQAAANNAKNTAEASPAAGASSEASQASSGAITSPTIANGTSEEPEAFTGVSSRIAACTSTLFALSLSVFLVHAIVH